MNETSHTTYLPWTGERSMTALTHATDISPNCFASSEIDDDESTLSRARICGQTTE